MVGGNSALLLLVKGSTRNRKNKDLCPLLEQHVKVDLIINLSFLKCLKEAPKNASKENYGLCIESSTIDLSFCKKLDKGPKEYLKEYIECLKKCCPESNKPEPNNPESKKNKCPKFLDEFPKFSNNDPDKCDKFLEEYFEFLGKYSEFLEKCCSTNKKNENGCPEGCPECVEKCGELNKYIDFIERL